MRLLRGPQEDERIFVVHDTLILSNEYQKKDPISPIIHART
jgi:hypothetical protein